MILCTVSDAAYLVLPNARSHCATLYTLTDLPTTTSPISNSCSLQDNVRCTCICCWSWNRWSLHGWPRGYTHHHCSTGNGPPTTTQQYSLTILLHMTFFLHHKFVWKAPKLSTCVIIGSRMEWLRNSSIYIGQRTIYNNRADYFTIHHPLSHHKLLSYEYLQCPQGNIVMPHLWVCVSPFGISRLLPRHGVAVSDNLLTHDCSPNKELIHHHQLYYAVILF